MGDAVIKIANVMVFGHQSTTSNDFIRVANLKNPFDYVLDDVILLICGTNLSNFDGAIDKKDAGLEIEK